MAKRFVGIRWSIRAKNDLQDIYEFYIPIVGEEKAFGIIQNILSRVTALEKSQINFGTRFRSERDPEMQYFKIGIPPHLVFYQVQNKEIQILRLFDGRQNPEKLGL